MDIFIKYLALGYKGYKAERVDEVDEGMRLGDYPVLPWHSAQELPPRGWWDDQDRRNKEDPVNYFSSNSLCLFFSAVARTR